MMTLGLGPSLTTRRRTNSLGPKRKYKNILKINFLQWYDFTFEICHVSPTDVLPSVILGSDAETFYHDVFQWTLSFSQQKINLRDLCWICEAKGEILRWAFSVILLHSKDYSELAHLPLENLPWRIRLTRVTAQEKLSCIVFVPHCWSGFQMFIRFNCCHGFTSFLDNSELL